MRLHTIVAAAVCALLLSTPHAPAEAAGAKSKKNGAARTVAAKAAASPGKVKRAGKSVSARSPSGKLESKVKVKGGRSVAFAAALPAYMPPPEVPLTLAQLDVARLVQTGVVHCEFGQSVVIEPQARRAGAFHVRFGRAVYDMVPEETSTGAVRLSDARAGVVWLQIPVKSMLMDARQGQRMVDACTTPFQRSAQAMAAARSAHPGSMAAAADGLGIAPGSTVGGFGTAGVVPVAAGALAVGSPLVPAVVTPPAAALASVPAVPGPAPLVSSEPGSSADPGSAGAITADVMTGGSGTGGTGVAGDSTLIPSRPGATAAAPSPAWTSEGAPLPLPVRPPVVPN